jgi:thiamine biosynthesis lipoprotein ApbE
VAETMQVTVMASTASESDALSTAMFVLGPEGATDLLDDDRGINALLVRKRGGGREVVAIGWPWRVNR